MAKIKIWEDFCILQRIQISQSELVLQSWFYISVCDELELVPDGKVVFHMFFGETGWCVKDYLV